MAWIAPLTFGALALGAAAVVWTLTANLEPQPEYPWIMTAVIRLLGGLIAASAGFLGLVFLVLAVRTYAGW